MPNESIMDISNIWENVNVLQAIIQSSPIAIVVIDKDGKVKLLNYGAEMMFGWNEQEIVGEVFPIFANRIDVLQTISKQEVVENYEVQFSNKTGLAIDVSFSSVHLFDKENMLYGVLVIFKDISERKREEFELKRSLKELTDIKFALDQSAIIAITDRAGRITYVNDTFCEMSQYSREELLGQDHRIINSGYHPKSFFKDMWKTIGSGKIWRGEVRNRKKNGEYYWVFTTIVPMLRQDGKPYRYISIRTDITEQKKAQERVKFLAYYDELTLLPNRRLFKMKLEEALNEAIKTNEEIAILCIDLDRFKMVNDTLGHHYGDMLLRFAAKKMKKCLHENDLIARHGGDEFVMFIRDVTRDKIENIARNLIKSFEAPFLLGNNQYFISGSIGISRFPHDGYSFDELIQKADIAINRVKEQGKNHFQFYDLEMDQLITRESTIEKNLREAIHNNEFTLHYQPKMELETSEIVGMEALLRWNNKELGFVSPAEFIPVAEDTGMIIPIGEWVLRTVCKQLKEWELAGRKLKTVSINLSFRQFQDPSLIDMFQSVINETGVDPHFLEIELTENIAAHDKDFVSQKLQAIRSLGVKISIDDFGTGYSSLKYLKDYPIDSIKIDKSFVDEIFHTGESSIVRAIIAMSHSMYLSVVAEGVETKEQLEYLKNNNCNTIQGYLISRPLPADEFEKKFLMID